VTIDRFHVVKNFQEQLTEARREIQRGLDKEAAKELKGTRWLWQTNPENLTDVQRQQLESLKERFPKLQQLVQQRESLRALFEDRTIQDAAVGAERLRAWLEQARGARPASVGEVLQDAVELAGPDRQLFRVAVE
jgi:transposase